MYEAFYGFAQAPFNLSPDPKFLYLSESHDNALQQVWQAIHRKEGFIVLSGDIGTGKTTLCRTILDQFDPTTFTALILNPFLSLDELLQEILISYGVVSRETLRSGRLARASKGELIRTLHDFLRSLEPVHGSAVLIIDEAQHLSPDVLEEVRVLSNLETNERKLLLIVLVGQLNLLDVLRDAKLRQLDQRISQRCLLQPLTRSGVEAYIAHRLTVARGTRQVSFTPDAVDLVHAISGGVPRIINLLCDRALMAGAEAQTLTISDDLVRRAAEALGLAAAIPAPAASTVAGRRGALRVAGIAIAALAAVLLAVYAVSFTAASSLTGVEPPLVMPPSAAALGVRQAAPLPVPQETASLSAPNIETGAFSVVAGTYATPREAEQAIKTLRERRLPVYAVDVRIEDAVRRRVMVGRFRVRDEAVKVQSDLAPSFPEARIVYGWFERVP
jgi:general secretion pathway protein A